MADLDTYEIWYLQQDRESVFAKNRIRRWWLEKGMNMGIVYV